MYIVITNVICSCLVICAAPDVRHPPSPFFLWAPEFGPRGQVPAATFFFFRQEAHSCAGHARGLRSRLVKAALLQIRKTRSQAIPEQNGCDRKEERGSRNEGAHE